MSQRNFYCLAALVLVAVVMALVLGTGDRVHWSFPATLALLATGEFLAMIRVEWLVQSH